MDRSGRITSFFKALPKGAPRPPIRWSEPKPKRGSGRQRKVATSRGLSLAVAAADCVSDIDIENDEESSHEEDNRDEDGHPPKKDMALI